MGLLSVTAYHTIEIPKDFKLSWNHGVGAEDAPACEVGLQAFKHDYVGSENKKRLRIVFGNVVSLTGGIEKLPSHGKGHHLRFSTTRGHLDAVSGEIVERRQPQIAKVLRVTFQKTFTRADFLEFPNEKERFNRFLLR